MNKTVKKYLVNVVVFYILIVLFDSASMHSIGSVFVAGLVLSVLNILVKPILSLLMLPITLLTLGLFTFIINAIVIWLMDIFVSGIKLGGFGMCLLAALMITGINLIIKDEKK